MFQPQNKEPVNTEETIPSDVSFGFFGNLLIYSLATENIRLRYRLWGLCAERTAHKCVFYAMRERERERMYIYLFVRDNVAHIIPYIVIPVNATTMCADVLQKKVF